MIKRKFVFAHMNVATEYAKLSSCQRLKVGALLVKDGTPIAIGYNGTKPGQDNCCEGADGKTLPTVRHAEINALNKLWTTNEKAAGAALFVTHAPCVECAQDLYNAGVRDYYFRWHYRDDSGLRFLLKNGATVHKVLPDIDAIHRLSLRYNLNTDLEIAYDKIDEIKEVNEEAARASGSVGLNNCEVRDLETLRWEIFGEILEGAEIHAGDGGYQEVPLDQYIPAPNWEAIFANITIHHHDEDEPPTEGFIPFGEGTVESKPSSWPFPTSHLQPKPGYKKPWNGPGGNNTVRPKP
jgi:dCMP deaminase